MRRESHYRGRLGDHNIASLIGLLIRRTAWRLLQDVTLKKAGRATRTRVSDLQGEDKKPWVEAVSRERTPTQEAVRNELNEIVHRTLGTLKARGRSMLISKYVDGLTQREMSAKYGQSPPMCQLTYLRYADLFREAVKRSVPSLEGSIEGRKLHRGAKNSVPMYLLHTDRNASGGVYRVAGVRIKNKYHHLGPYNSPQSIEKYKQLLAEHGYPIPSDFTVPSRSI